MERRNVFVALLVSLMFLLGFGATAHAQFTNASLLGTYAFQFTGTSGNHVELPVPDILGPGTHVASFPILVPRAGTGQVVADGAGTITSGNGVLFSQDITKVGDNPPTYPVVDNSCSVSITGTYSINVDGTGTMTLNIAGPCGSPVTLNLILTGGGAGAVFYTTPAPNPDAFSTVVSGTFALQ